MEDIIGAVIECIAELLGTSENGKTFIGIVIMLVVVGIVVYFVYR